MKNRKCTFLENLFLIAMIALFVIVIGGLIGIEIYVWVTYANTPISEIPIWALIFMLGGKR